jgi:hypothetical protein
MDCRQYVREKLGLHECKPDEPRLKTVSEIVAEYDYRDETGDLLFQVVRFEPKDFRQRVRWAGVSGRGRYAAFLVSHIDCPD